MQSTKRLYSMGRDPKRIPKFLAVLEKVWMKNPDLRFGQLLSHVAKDPVLYYLEEDELLQRIEAMYEIVEKSK